MEIGFAGGGSGSGIGAPIATQGGLAFEPPVATAFTATALCTLEAFGNVENRGMFAAIARSGAGRGASFTTAAPNAANYCFVARLQGHGNAFSTESSFGLIAKNSVNGRCLTLDRPHQREIYFQRWATESAFTAGIANGIPILAHTSWPLFLAIGVANSGVVTAYFSGDGITWYPSDITDTISAWIGGIDRIGFHLYTGDTAGQKTSMLVPYWKVLTGTAVPQAISG